MVGDETHSADLMTEQHRHVAPKSSGPQRFELRKTRSRKSNVAHWEQICLL
eukprot:CAMPEP_0204361028 /NCGR_PEP_ID=MMETSP0469-20131031/38505_1 /ASSEMBLY_ACC=CAM_ASM_000384 /TAXON_ID=2969 /ORGANISM="Oxyrrhis marina" /LENGTH=50 /DNA_ID=CAMNT_0051349357 /DNA_START=452 /DNA_END=604 /DNA_ORIENTATION=+